MAEEQDYLQKMIGTLSPELKKAIDPLFNELSMWEESEPAESFMYARDSALGSAESCDLNSIIMSDMPWAERNMERAREIHIEKWAKENNSTPYEVDGKFLAESHHKVMFVKEALVAELVDALIRNCACKLKGAR